MFKLDRWVGLWARKAPEKAALKFHAEIWLPNLKGLPAGKVALAYTTHAVEAAAEDRYQGLPDLLPLELDTKVARLIEVGTTRQLVPLSCLYRLDLDGHWDLCVVIRPPVAPATAWVGVTVWTNHKRDRHATLDPTKYVGPPSRLEMICQS